MPMAESHTPGRNAEICRKESDANTSCGAATMGGSSKFMGDVPTDRNYNFQLATFWLFLLVRRGNEGVRVRRIRHGQCSSTGRSHCR